MKGKKRKQLSEMSLDELKALQLNRSSNVRRYRSLIPSNFEQLLQEYQHKNKRDFNEERRKLRQDPKNQIKTGLFGLGLMKWTDECEKKCQALDNEQKLISNLGVSLEQSNRNRVFLEEELTQLSLIESQIQKLLKKEELLKRKRLKHEELKIRAKRNEDEVRAMASSVKRSISEIEHACPYCGGELGQTPHADHIYPVSKGGLSVSKNMVMVCSKCNLKKKDLTLREFITKFSMNRSEIENRLDELGKSF
jgi:5-methylcytosine-specific restriction endonuclease McrA